MVWDGRRWKLGAAGEIERLAKETVRAMYAEAATTADGAKRARLGEWALKCESAHRIRNMVDLARSEVAVQPEDLDTDLWLFNVANGTLDLRTGQLRPHNRDDYITKLAPVAYDASATAPTWHGFLHKIMSGNENLTKFLQRAIGYSLTGNTSERSIFINYGVGRNGKSTLQEAIGRAVGDYGQRTPTDTLLVKRDGAIPNDVARLKGARFVWASEAEEGKRLAEALIKDLTGRDTISARFMRGEWFDYVPEFKIWLATNHKPQIRVNDKGIWDRIKLIPFDVRITEEEKDPELPEKLDAERSGILACAVRDCLEWQQQGLGVPDEVRRATQGYQAEMDLISQFLEEACVLDAGCKVSSGDLYRSYKLWCVRNNEQLISQKAMANRLAERGYEKRDVGHSKTPTWFGIGLRSGLDSGGR